VSAEALEPRQMFAADLQATAFNMYGGPLLRTGDPQTATLTVQNKNVIWFLDDAGTFVVNVYISDDPTITTSDTLLCSVIYNGLGAGQSDTRTFACPRVPPNVPDVDPIRTDNRYWIGVVVDANGTVNESDESNNANRGDGIDRETVWGERHLPAPLDGASVQADTLLGTYNGEIGGTSEWMGGYDIDVAQSTLYAGDTYAYDVDSASTLDPYLRIYNSSWQLVAENDNGAGAGEAVGKDPFIQYTVPTTGTYYFVISSATNKSCDPRTLAGRSAGSAGSYTIYTTHIWNAPSTPDLEDSSDTGVSPTDNITRDNTPTFLFSSVPNLETFLIANGSVIAHYPTPNPTYSYEVTTPALPDGSYDISVRCYDPATGYNTLTSASLHIVIDTAPPAAPTPAAMSFAYATAPHAVMVSFADDVGASLTDSDLLLTDAGASYQVPVACSYDPTSRRATFRVAGTPSIAASTFNGLLAQGNYRATLNGAGITDVAGNAMVGSPALDFFFLPGDANHDRAVDTLDFNALAANFGKINRTFSQADFNYDGVVDTLDFNTLAAQFGKSLPTASSGALQPATSGPVRSVFGASVIGNAPTLRLPTDVIDPTK
jgi:hypothetical protein